MQRITPSRPYHYDGLGSVANVTDANGLPQWSYSYEPFGNSRTTTKVNPLAADNPMRFTGEYQDPTGLYHLRARQYDPGLGRFTATDPWSPLMSDPYVASYAYANNRPGLYIDPSGNFGIVGGIIGGVIGGTTGAISAWVGGGDGGDILQGALIGAGTGAVIGATGGLSAPMVGFLAGGASNVVGQVAAGTPLDDINWCSAGLSAVVGAGSGWVGGEAATFARFAGANQVGQGIVGGLADIVGPTGVANMLLGSASTCLCK